MGEFKVDERIYETSVTTGTGEYTLAGAVTGFQPASVLGANNYGPFFITDDTNWEAVIGTYVTGPNRLQRTAVKASSNGGAAVNWGAGTKKIRCGWPAWLAAPSMVTKSVAGAADVTLTAAEQRCDILILTGALTGNINVIVDVTKWDWIIHNNTSGAYTLTVKTSAGTGKAITQGKRAQLYCDGTNVESSDDTAVPLSGGNLTGGLNEGLSTVASAATPDIFATTIRGTIDYTGTATCTGFVAAPQAGARRTLVCAGAAVFTAGANMLIDGVTSGNNFTAAAGDKIHVIAVTTTQFRLTPAKYDGTPVATMLGGLNKSIYGFTYANAAVDATNDLDIAAGGCIDATGAQRIVVAALTKQSDVAWAVGNNAGGLDTGAVGNSDYYIWAILRSDTGVTDFLFSLSSTAPTMPAGYDYKRLVGWFKRVGGTIVAFTTYETAGGGLDLLWTVPTLDVDLANTLTTSEREDAVKVPLNLSTIAHLNVNLSDAASAFTAWIYCPDHTSAAPSTTAAPLGTMRLQVLAQVYTLQMSVRTSATGTIAARADLATVNSYQVVTLGFSWSRR